MAIPQPPTAVFVDAGGVLLLPAFEFLVEHFELGDVTFEELYHAYFAAFEQYDPEQPEEKWLWTVFLRHFGKSEDVIAEKTAPLIASVLDPWGTGPVAAPGAMRFLQVLEEAKIPTVVVSNARGNVGRLLLDASVCQAGAGEFPSVTAIIDSHNVGVRKPDPRIFRFARQAVEAATGDELNLDDCVHIGDALWSDVRAADEAGIAVIHLDPEGACVEKPMHAHVRNLDEALALIGVPVTPA